MVLQTKGSAFAEMVTLLGGKLACASKAAQFKSSTLEELVGKNNVFRYDKGFNVLSALLMVLSEDQVSVEGLDISISAVIEPDNGFANISSQSFEEVKKGLRPHLKEGIADMIDVNVNFRGGEFDGYMHMLVLDGGAKVVVCSDHDGRGYPEQTTKFLEGAYSVFG